MRPRQFTDEQLLETARRCFLQHGPNVSTSTIASELGVSPAALFKRVGTKDALLRRALSDGMYPAWHDLATAGPDERPIPDQLRELAHSIDDFFRRLLPRLSVMKAAGLCPKDIFDQFDEPPPVVGHRALTGWFARLAEHGRARVPRPEATALAFLGSLQARHALRHAIGETYPDGGPFYLDVLVETFWAGIAPTPKENA